VVAGRARANVPVDDTSPSTRDRILDIALDLFIEQGFDKTSLREIADRLGFSKAAIYYHFASKADIFMALHLRLHEFGRRAFQRLAEEPAGLAAWARLFDDTLEEMLANRKIFVMHDRNRTAFEELHRKEHDDAHADMDEQLRRVMTNPAVPVRDRIRLACSVGAVMSGLALSSDLLDDVGFAELGEALREVVGLLLGTARPAPPDAGS
jgi:AcrR family transcriptional regulator